MMRQLIKVNNKPHTLSFLTGICCAFISLTAISENSKSSIQGRVNIQIDAGSIKNIIQHSHESSSTMRIGTISKSSLNSADINVQVDESSNTVENATSSSARTNIGTITNASLKKAKIEVDVKRVETKVMGGKNNNALTNIGVLKDTNIQGTVSINVRAKEVSNIIAGGTDNEAEVSIGYDPSGETTSVQKDALYSNATNQSASVVKQRITQKNSSMNPYLTMVQSVAGTNSNNPNQTRLKKDASGFPYVPRNELIYQADNYYPPMRYITRPDDCLDASKPETCLQAGGIPGKLFISQHWVDANVATYLNKNSSQKKHDVKTWIRIKRDKFGKIKVNPWTTLAGVGLDVVKNHQITQDHFTTKKRYYQVERKFITIYTALSPEYKKIAKQFNKQENGLRVKQYAYSKVSGGSESGIKKVPFYGDSAEVAREKALKARAWETYGR